MNNGKRISIISLLLVFILIMTGCSPADGKVLKAIKKQQDIRAFKSDLEISFNLSSEGFDDETSEMIAEISKNLNDFVLKMEQVIIQNESKDQAKGKLDISGKLGEKTYSGNIWIDANLKGDETSLVEIFKLPKEIMDLGIGNEIESKEYILYDFNEIMENALGDEELPEEDFKSIMDWSIKAQSKMEKFIEDFGKDADLDIDIVKSKGKKEIDGEKLDIYEIELNDEDFKDILRYTGNTILEDENLKVLFDEYIELLTSITMVNMEAMESLPEVVDEDEDEIIQIEVDELKAIRESFSAKEEFNKFMDTIKDVKIIGEDGVKLELGVNKAGFIVSEKANVNMVFDMEDYSKIISTGEEETMKGKINFNIKTNVKMSNINDKNLKVDMPKITEENSYTFTELMEIQEKAMEQFMEENMEIEEFIMPEE